MIEARNMLNELHGIEDETGRGETLRLNCPARAG